MTTTLEFFSSPGKITNPGKYATLFDPLTQ